MDYFANFLISYVRNGGDNITTITLSFVLMPK